MTFICEISRKGNHGNVPRYNIKSPEPSHTQWSHGGPALHPARDTAGFRPKTAFSVGSFQPFRGFFFELIFSTYPEKGWGIKGNLWRTKIKPLEPSDTLWSPRRPAADPKRDMAGFRPKTALSGGGLSHFRPFWGKKKIFSKYLEIWWGIKGNILRSNIESPQASHNRWSPRLPAAHPAGDTIVLWPKTVL